MDIEQIMARMPRAENPSEQFYAGSYVGYNTGFSQGVEAQCRLDAQWILDHWKEIEEWMR